MGTNRILSKYNSRIASTNRLIGESLRKMPVIIYMLLSYSTEIFRNSMLLCKYHMDN